MEQIALIKAGYAGALNASVNRRYAKTGQYQTKRGVDEAAASKLSGPGSASPIFDNDVPSALALSGYPG